MPTSFASAGGYDPLGRWRQALLGLHVATEVHQRRDRLGRERRGGARVLERIGAWAYGLACAAGEDLALDRAGVAVVDGPQDDHRAAFLAHVAHEQLAEAGDAGRVAGLAEE